jgi:hypothetical protein
MMMRAGAASAMVIDAVTRTAATMKRVSMGMHLIKA